MSPKKNLFFICLLINPLLLVAEEQKGHKHTPGGEIAFRPSSRAAFDHSGQLVTHRILADGSMMAEHNGSLGNVTVARLGPDGKVETFCTTDEEAAKSWMAGEIGRSSVASLNTPVVVKKP